MSAKADHVAAWLSGFWIALGLVALAEQAFIWGGLFVLLGALLLGVPLEYWVEKQEGQ